MGSIWGIAYGKNCDKLLLASGVKGQSDMGPNGVGAIYIADNSTNSTTNSVTTAPLWLDLEALGLEFGTNPYDNIPYQPFDINRDAYAFIGKAGIGDIDISDDGNFLYLTNLHNRSLVKVPIGANCTAPTSAANIIETNIPNPLSCDDIVRPWATKYHEGKVYVGMVCTGEQANVNVDTKAQVNREDLRAYVYIYDPSTDQFETNPVLEFSLLYDRTWSARECPAAWQPWQDRFVYDLLFVRTQNGFASYPQPILSDIEFDGCEMLLAFSDRMGSQFGRAVPPSSELSDGSFVNQGTGNAIQIMPAGDMLIAGYNGNGTWTLEDNGMVTSICGNRTTTNADPNTNRLSLIHI